MVGKLSFHYSVAENFDNIIDALFEVNFTVVAGSQRHFQSFNSSGNANCSKCQVINFKNVFTDSFNQDAFNHSDFFLLMPVFDIFNEFNGSHIVFKSVVKISHASKGCQFGKNVISQFVNRIGITIYHDLKFHAKNINFFLDNCLKKIFFTGKIIVK